MSVILAEMTVEHIDHDIQVGFDRRDGFPSLRKTLVLPFRTVERGRCGGRYFHSQN